MSLPETIHIGVMDYAVTELPELKSDDGKALYAQISYQYEEIRVWEATTLRMKQVQLWHEALHGMMMQSGLHGIDLEEPIVIALSHALVSVIRANPELIAYTLADEPNTA